MGGMGFAAFLHGTTEAAVTVVVTVVLFLLLLPQKPKRVSWGTWVSYVWRVSGLRPDFEAPHADRNAGKPPGSKSMDTNNTIVYHNVDPDAWKFGAATKDPKSRITTVSVNTKDGGYVRVQLPKDVNHQADVLMMNDFEKNGQYKLVTSVSAEERAWWASVRARISRELVSNGDAWLGRSVSPEEADGLITVPMQNNEQWGDQTVLKVTPKSKCFRFVPSDKPDQMRFSDFDKDDVVRHSKMMAVVSMSKIYITDGMVRLPAYVDHMVVDPSAVPQEPSAFQM
jgi:hypothetical protein